MKKSIGLNLYAVSLLSAILFSSCKKDNVQSTPVTLYNTLATPTLSSYNISAYESGLLLTFNAASVNYSNTIYGKCISDDFNYSYNLFFNFNSFYKGYIGTYPLGDTLKMVAPGAYALYNEFQIQDGYGEVFSYCTDDTHTGTLSITAYDSIHKTLSGTFNFTGAGGVGIFGGSYPATISITNGVFTKVPLPN